ncbi:DA1-related 5 [Spatholobus suberectus]|nr:DA1-related 5 [Spatholobus suberectus]
MRLVNLVSFTLKETADCFFGFLRLNFLCVTFEVIQVMGLCGEAALGAALQEGPKQVAGLVSRALKFRSARRDLGFAVRRAIPVAQEMERLNEELDRPEEERGWLLGDLQDGERIFNAHSSVPWWQCCWLPCYQNKLQEALEALTRSTIFLMPMVARNVQEILLTERNGIRGKQLKSRFQPPPQPDLVVGLGLDNPLSLFNKLKRQLLETGTSVLVLTGLAGYGKTTLATLLCWDDHVRVSDIIGQIGQH